MDSPATGPPDYSTYTALNFVMDDSFRRWILSPDDEVMTYWHTFMLRQPQQQTTIDEAASLLLHLRMNYDALAETSQQRIWQLLEQAVEANDRPVRPLIPWRRIGSWSAAASLAGILITAGSVWYARQPHQQTVRTAYGKTINVTLPDGSTVLLNGNSSLTYTDKWPAGQPREVWLNGEGFFRVSKQMTPAGRVKFTTHTPNLDITVLGTQFTVNTRRGNTDVMLLEGKVTLTQPGQSAHRVLEMKPGELATATAGVERVAVRPEKALPHVAWVQHQFVFEGTPLREVARQLNDSEGIELIFEDNALADRRFTANLANQSVETLVETLTATFDLTTEREGNRIYVRRLSN